MHLYSAYTSLFCKKGHNNIIKYMLTYNPCPFFRRDSKMQILL